MAESILSTEFQMVVLPPRESRVPGVFRNAKKDAQLHSSLLTQLQRFRGAIYLEDGAISRCDLTRDGRHAVEIDQSSWHLLSLNAEGHIYGCSRFLEESAATSFDELWLRTSAAARCPVLEGRIRRAVESQMARAKAERIGFGEVGGWAISKSRRMSVEALRMVLAMYGLLQLLGECLAVATATLRHNSANILRRIGLSGLTADSEQLPGYYDAHHQCEMQVLRLDSRLANPRFAHWIAELRSHLKAVPVVSGGLAPFEVPAACLSPMAAWGLPATS